MAMSPPIPEPAAELFRVFGPRALALGLFYVNTPALRLELSRYGPWLEQFEQAWDRAREVADTVFADTERLVVVVSGRGGPPLLAQRELFRSVRDCGVRMERPRGWWSEPDVDEIAGVRTFVAFTCGREALHRLLWGALAVDLGVRPRLRGELYVADPARGVLIYPYDDRGMDVIGPNHALLAELHRRFGDYLLNYDRERMDGWFAPGVPPAGS
jgi:hypothetical protein